jgi:hypothetical protein
MSMYLEASRIESTSVRRRMVLRLSWQITHWNPSWESLAATSLLIGGLHLDQVCHRSRSQNETSRRYECQKKRRQTQQG